MRKPNVYICKDTR